MESDLKIYTSQQILDLMEELYSEYSTVEQELEFLMELEELESLTAFLLLEEIHHNVTVVKYDDNLYLVKLYYYIES